MANIDDKKIPVGGKETPIPNRLHDVSEDHVVTGANEVFDDAFNERQSQVNNKLRHYTKMAHIRIDAEEITREHNDNLLNQEINAKQLEIGAVETDIEPVLESHNMLPSGAVAFNLGWYRGNENPEWVYCITDGAKRIIAGIKFDGSIEWMVGVPTPVKNYVDGHIQELIERLEELGEHILEELEKKVDKEEGKSLIDKDYADGITYIENPEFVEVKLDNEGKILEAIMPDGTKMLAGGTNVQGVVTKVENNPEYIMVVLDSVKNILFGVKKDGDFIFGCGIPSAIEEAINKIVEYIEENFGDAKKLFKYYSNIEYLFAVTDAENHFMFGLTKDGKLKAVAFEGDTDLDWLNEVYSNEEDLEERLELKLDKNGNIISYRKKNGVLVELAGIEAPNIQTKSNFIVKKSGGGDYTSLTRAIMDNFGRWGVTLYLEEGEYDLLAELEEYYGTVNFLQLTPRGRGIELGYDIIIKGSPNAVIKADYIGEDTDMLTFFSPFNCYNTANTGGFSLIGINIQCSRVRYVIHDEKSGVAGTYNNLYDNCNFFIDNTNNESWGMSVCIGGGLGKSGCIIIRSCIFEGVYPNRQDALVSYHNASIAGAKSFISCMGNYLKDNKGFRFSWYGNSTDITEVLVEGNNVGRATIVGPEPGTVSPNENVHVTEWNTIVRNN